MVGSDGWSVQVVAADAAALHAADLGVGPGIWLMIPTRAAIVLGSSQTLGDVDADWCASRGLDVVRRRSGGGAVWVDPVQSVWVDVVIGRDDPLWVDDVGKAMHFVGRAWRDALVELGMSELTLNEGPHVSNDWSKQLCVAGRGSGEVFAASSAKVVGISQRRTRDFARFQCIAYFEWDVALHARAIPMVGRDPDRIARLVETVPRLEPRAVATRLAASLPAR